MPESADNAQSMRGLLGLAGALDLCCLGTAALAGGAVFTGVSVTGVTAMSGGMSSPVGILAIGLATALPLFAIGLILRWGTN